MIYYEFFGDKYNTYNAAYDACCEVPPEDIEIFQELYHYSSLEILEAIRNGNTNLYEEIINSLNEERSKYIIEVEEEEDEEETQFSSFLVRRITSKFHFCQIFIVLCKPIYTFCVGKSPHFASENSTVSSFDYQIHHVAGGRRIKI